MPSALHNWGGGGRARHRRCDLFANKRAFSFAQRGGEDGGRAQCRQPPPAERGNAPWRRGPRNRIETVRNRLETGLETGTVYVETGRINEKVDFEFLRTSSARRFLCTNQRFLGGF